VPALLFVCTANQARSAFAEFVFKSLEFDFQVTSAGTQARAGRPCDPNTLTVARRLGFDLSEHRSSSLVDSHLRTNDIVICMTNEHLRYAVGLFTKSWTNTFTLPDFVRRASMIGPRMGANLNDYLAVIHKGRLLKDAWTDGGASDIPDPIERSLNGHQTILENVQKLTETLGALLR
jgi:protein-tyrosine-phosphatase